MQMEDPKNGPSIVEVTQCEDCDGMYDLCVKHGEYTTPEEEGREDQDQPTNPNQLRDLNPAEVPRNPGLYGSTNHAMDRMEERNVSRSEIHTVITEGRCKHAKGKNRFRFEHGEYVVFVSVDVEAMDAGDDGLPHWIVTVYRNE